MKVITLTVLVNDDHLGHPRTTDALGDVCRELEAEGIVVGFNFTGGTPASHVTGPGDVRIDVPPPVL